jgi:hypothetical protein
MQTFLPYPDLKKSFEVLDYRRLGKQRVEAMQILNILLSDKKSGGWVNHPAVKMWRGYEDALCVYMNMCIYRNKQYSTCRSYSLCSRYFPALQ